MSSMVLHHEHKQFISVWDPKNEKPMATLCSGWASARASPTAELLPSCRLSTFQDKVRGQKLKFHDLRTGCISYE